MRCTSEFYFSQTLRRPLEDCGWKDIHETSFSLLKKLDGRKNAVLADSFERDCTTSRIMRSFFLLCYYNCLSQGCVRLYRVGLSAAVTPSPYDLLLHHDIYIVCNHKYLLPPVDLATWRQCDCCRQPYPIKSNTMGLSVFRDEGPNSIFATHSVTIGK